MKKNILVAMSGGVDSAVAALLLKENNNIGGITMRVWSDSEELHDCVSPCSDTNCIEARAISDILGIPHHTVSYGDSFKSKVVNRFLDDYINGRTPNPCVECNKHIKFGLLYKSAKELGYDYIATGHYARIEQDENGRFLLKKAKDINKDQSYFLWAIDKSLLPYIIFPLGSYEKPAIRDIAKQHGFSNAQRADSQDICFIEKGDYVSFIHKYSSNEFPMGNFIDTEGNVLGRHSGIINYTVGQRKGLGIALGKPMFVCQKNITDNTVTLCSDEELYKDSVEATDINILTEISFDVPTRLQVKIRYRHTPAWATVTKKDENTLSVKFDLPQRAIAQGQSMVMYDGDIVVGGGIIK